MKLVVIWSNGDKQKIPVSEATAMRFETLLPICEWESTTVTSADRMRIYNIKHAREMWIE